MKRPIRLASYFSYVDTLAISKEGDMDCSCVPDEAGLKRKENECSCVEKKKLGRGLVDSYGTRVLVCSPSVRPVERIKNSDYGIGGPSLTK